MTATTPDGPRRALVIGCGFLGERVAALLAREGLRVTGTTRRRERIDELATRGIDGATLDFATASASRVWDTSYDAAVWCASPGRSPAGERGDPRAVYVDGVASALAALARAACARTVVVSSTGVYHQTDGSWLDETSPAEPRDEPHRSIREGEELALAAGASVVRLGGLYGPGRSPLEWLRRANFAERLADSSAAAWMNWIRIEDAAAVVAAATLRGRPEAVYVGVDGHPVERAEFWELAAELTGVDAPRFAGDPRDRGKRLRPERTLAELGVTLRFPDFRCGLRTLALPHPEAPPPPTERRDE